MLLCMLHDFPCGRNKSKHSLQKAGSDEPRASETKATNNQEKEVDSRKDPWMELIVGDEFFSTTTC